MASLKLDSPVANVPLIGPASAGKLVKLGITTVKNLLFHIPSRYLDFSKVTKIGWLRPGETVTVQGEITKAVHIPTSKRLTIQKAEIADDTGTISAVWFNQPFLLASLKPGQWVNLSGKVSISGKKLQLESPQFEIISGPLPGPLQEVLLQRASIHTGRLVPVYPETEGVTSKWLRSRLDYLLGEIKGGKLEIPESLPEAIRQKHDLVDLKTALLVIHFPEKIADIVKAKERLALEELLPDQVQGLVRRRERQETVVGHKFQITSFRPQLKTFIRNLPFTLTAAQRRAIDEIFQDLAHETPMNRLLQGDVGSGKTVVAALSMLVCHLNNYQSVLMAPTEILVHQHHQTLRQLLNPLGTTVGLVTATVKDSTNHQLFVGTHALLTAKINFDRLGLVIIDEQHRFGVDQRAQIAAKGQNPHLLSMTATPIPRTVALTRFGDLDISLLDELPEGRLPVKTWVVPQEKRPAAYEWLRQQTSPVYIVCPLIDPSESLATVKAAEKEYTFLSEKIFPEKTVGLLHGKMTPKEKEAALSRFKRGESNILVATPVIEVGIDVAAATIMVIEGADRFGLAQLHQLRGRVGRAGQQAYCLLFTDSQDPGALSRLKHLETERLGLRLAEIDLTLRGPGQRFGLAQHGSWDYKIADYQDFKLTAKAATIAQEVLTTSQDFPGLFKTDRIGKIKATTN